jgi:acyl carrier protein
MTEVTRFNAKRIAVQRAALMLRIKASLIERLSLQLEPDEIAEDTTLFGTGLGLDSVDALEVALSIESEFEVAVGDEDINGIRSVNLIADYIMSKQNGTRDADA